MGTAAAVRCDAPPVSREAITAGWSWSSDLSVGRLYTAAMDGGEAKNDDAPFPTPPGLPPDGKKCTFGLVAAVAVAAGGGVVTTVAGTGARAGEEDADDGAETAVPAAADEEAAEEVDGWMRRMVMPDPPPSGSGASSAVTRFSGCAKPATDLT